MDSAIWEGVWMNVYEAVKENVTARQAAQAYGIRISRSGMAICPFHNDKNPSMKLDKRFHCFGCQADGDAIDFTARLYRLSAKEAAEKLAADFGLRYESRDIRTKKPIKRKLSEELHFRKSVQECRRVFLDYYHLLMEWEKEYVPQQQDKEWHPLFEEALQNRSRIEYLLDILISGTAEEKADVLVKHGKEAEQLRQRIAGFTRSKIRGQEEYRRRDKNVPER